jgi:hypothetical protein
LRLQQTRYRAPRDRHSPRPSGKQGCLQSQNWRDPNSYQGRIQRDCVEVSAKYGTSASGTFRTCRLGPRMSVHWGRPEDGRSGRR